MQVVAGLSVWILSSVSMDTCLRRYDNISTWAKTLDTFLDSAYTILKSLFFSVISFSEGKI